MFEPKFPATCLCSWVTSPKLTIAAGLWVSDSILQILHTHTHTHTETRRKTYFSGIFRSWEMFSAAVVLMVNINHLPHESKNKTERFQNVWWSEENCFTSEIFVSSTKAIEISAWQIIYSTAPAPEISRKVITIDDLMIIWHCTLLFLPFHPHRLLLDDLRRVKRCVELYLEYRIMAHSRDHARCMPAESADILFSNMHTKRNRKSQH